MLSRCSPYHRGLCFPLQLMLITQRSLVMFFSSVDMSGVGDGGFGAFGNLVPYPITSKLVASKGSGVCAQVIDLSFFVILPSQSKSDCQPRPPRNSQHNKKQCRDTVGVTSPLYHLVWRTKFGEHDASPVYLAPSWFSDVVIVDTEPRPNKTCHLNSEVGLKGTELFWGMQPNHPLHLPTLYQPGRIRCSRLSVQGGHA